MRSCEFCEIFKNDCLVVHVWTAALHKKWSFPLRIPLVNVTKSAGNCGSSHIYWRNPQWKTSFFVQFWFWYLGISLRRDILCKVRIEEIFSSTFVFIHFKLILDSCTTLGVYSEPYQTSMMKVLAVVFSQKCSIIDIGQGSKYCSAASFLKYFSTFFVWILEWIYEHSVFLLKLCMYFAHVT